MGGFKVSQRNADCLRKYRGPGLHHTILRAVTSWPYVMPITRSEGLSTDTWYSQP